MRFFVRADSGGSIYARLKNSAGEYWNFSILDWVTPINVNCKKIMTEYPDSDPIESLYMVEADVPPGGPWIEEAVDDTDDTVLAYDDNVMGELEAVPTTNASWQEKLEFVFQYLANRRTATNTLETLYKEDGVTALGTSILADDGTIFDKNKVI